MNSEDNHQKATDENPAVFWFWVIIAALFFVNAVVSWTTKDSPEARAKREQMRDQAADNVLTTFCQEVSPSDNPPEECVNAGAAARERSKIREQLGHQ